MKTRTLLLLSLGCGLAIMLAGAALLIQLTGQDEALPPLAIGDAAQVGDMGVTVLTTTESGGELIVAVEIGGAADDAPADDFRLVASGRPLRVASSDCPAIDPVIDSLPTTTCSLTFDVSAADGSSRLLFYERGDDTARWLLA